MVVGQTYDLIRFATTGIDVADFGFTPTGGFNGTFAYQPDTLQFTLQALPKPTGAALLPLALAPLLRRPARPTPRT